MANQAELQLTPDHDALVSEIYIQAPAERIFEALTDPKQVLQWWGHAGMHRCTEFHGDVRPGGKWRSAGTGSDGSNFEVTGEYVEVDPPRLLVYTWVASWTGDTKTTVRWELEPSGQGTLLKIRHSGLGGYPKLAESYRGWSMILGWIRGFVERGETIDTRKTA